MKAIGFFAPGALDRDDALQLIELPDPVPVPHDLLVEVKAVSVNPVDTKVRAGGEVPPGGARILGYDAAGIVRAVGAEVSLFRPGEAVFYAGAINRAGSNGELQLVDERIVGRKPVSLSFAEAAALPLTAITAWELLFERMGVPCGVKRGGGSLLVMGGAGGVGAILIQLARRLTGLTVIATASRPETAAFVREMGAHHVIDHTRPLSEELARIGIPQVSYLAGLTGTMQHIAAYPGIIAPQGRLALIDDPTSLDIVPFKGKAITVAWEMMFTRSLFATPDMIEQHRLLNEVSALVDAGVLRTTVREHFGALSVESLKAAHARLESGRTIGKVVLDGF